MNTANLLTYTLPESWADHIFSDDERAPWPEDLAAFISKENIEILSIGLDSWFQWGHDADPKQGATVCEFYAVKRY